MLNEATQDRLAAAFPSLLDGSNALREIAEHASFKHFPAGATLYHEGDETAYLPLIVTGELAVTKLGETGREITLYRVGAGESCILSALGILNEVSFPATAEVSAEGGVVLVPAARVRELVDRLPAWRHFVFHLYQARLTALIALVEEVVFEKLDVRLAGFLLRHTTSQSPVLGWTHQRIAAELGSSREVISRVLKDWQRRGFIDVSRGAVSVADRGALQKVSNLVT
ncbi:Crp/Fnr family transcriptional regulator [Thioalkalivibrio sp.]|uniref:Crp/Fnr family transcriptional regulator n=1 Tax=Thioalkalivibrio sp. TaxID=2093813 RepID=UPI0039761F49